MHPRCIDPPSDSTGRSEHATVLCGGREVAAPCESCAVVDDYSDLGAHYRCDGARCPGVGREACAQPGTRLSDGAWLLSSGRPVCDLCCVLAVCGTTEGDEAERVHSVIVEMAG